ncbi:hypothetical protein DFH28DRAFT_1140014 [Melampsora americana]|nr:hypothetical protein DFH28DRAFT_1140014 [Melampsora americana]
MADQVINDDTPTSSQPSSPPQDNQVLTPLTFQIHPSALQAYSSNFNLNSGSPNFYTQPIAATVISPSPFGSSFNSMASLSQPQVIEQSDSPIKKNLQQTTKAQCLSTRKATSSKIPKSDSTNKSKGKKTKNSNDGGSTRKAPVYWEDEKNEKGESAISVLLNWITTYGIWTRYKDKNLVKSRTVEEIIDYLAKHGFYGRDVKNVEGKISDLESKFNRAVEWLNGTGQGVKDGIEAEKEKNGWADNNPEYLNRKKSLIEDYVVNHKCKYYYAIEHILGSRDKGTRLDSASSAISSK